MVFVKISSVLGVIAATSAVVNAAPQNYGSYGSASSVDATSIASAQSSSQTSSGYGSSSGGYGSSSGGYGSSSGGYGSSSGGYSGSSSSSCDSGDCSGSSSSSCDSGDCSNSSNTDTTSVYTSSSSVYTSSALATSVSQYYTSSVDSTDLATSTALATSVSMPSYGSGYSSWDSSGYDECVQQCIASYGAPGTYYAPTSTSESGSIGTGSAVTVIVAPTPGVFRYFPFATNASVGQTVQWQWGANNHTVTKSSELTICNKTDDNAFASGEQNTSFVFNQQINDTNPIFFYCGTPTHCEKGMFGVINPPSNFDAPTSVGSMMGSIIQNDTTGTLGTYYNYTVSMTANSSAASSWGSDIDMAGMDSSAYSLVVENVLFTRNVMAMNPDIINADGSINLDAVTSTNGLTVPQDVGSALISADSVSSSSSAAASSATGSSSSSSSAAPSSTASNGAISMTSSKVLVGAMAVIATFFAL